MPLHVFVETNWVLAMAAPGLFQDQGARALLERSRRGEIVLHLPAIALSEAQGPLRRRELRQAVENVRQYIRDRRAMSSLESADADAAFRVLSQFDQFIAHEKRDAPKRVAGLLGDPAIDVFALDEQMLERSVRLSTLLDLQSFDLAILSAVLVRARDVASPAEQVLFCTTDGDLQPWDKIGRDDPALKPLYDAAHVRVIGDFVASP